uniref:Uncharacterized protein n=1 Tax=Arsenophonus endosymbiont of Trialeurodes vaporariorum TaxID=235567 RepID=A0A3B0LUT6_9GAMM
MQSWGHDSRFRRRDSLPFPTKSGVMGITWAALGAAGPQEPLLARFADLDMQVLGFSRQDKNGTVASREPLLCDFHMVGSGYDDKDPWQSLLIPKKSDGKKTVGGGTKITYRYYLQDRAFAVLLAVPADLLATLVEALQQPVWDLALGRKNCVPTECIFQKQFSNLLDAEQAAEKMASEKQRLRDLTVV